MAGLAVRVLSKAMATHWRKARRHELWVFDSSLQSLAASLMINIWSGCDLQL